MCCSDGFEVITSSSSKYRLVMFVVKYCCDMPEKKLVSCVRQETMVDLPIICCPVTRDRL